MIPVSASITGLGIYAWKRKKPMWFWSGSTVSESEITDVPGYNRANGIMWIAFSSVLWAGTIVGCMNRKISGIIMMVGCALAVPMLPITYVRICKKYKIRQ